MKTSYHERDHIYGEAMLKLRTAIGLTQERLGNLLGISGRTVGKWEAGCVYPKPEHLKKLMALAVQHQAWASGSEAAEIRALWKVAHQKQFLDEHWLSTLLAGQPDLPPHMAEAGVEETKSLLPVSACPTSLPVEQADPKTEPHAPMLAVDQDTPVLQNLPFPPNPFFTGRQTELLLIAQLFEQSARIAISQPISVSGLGGIGKTQLALEYAHRCHPHIYRCVFWVNASDKASLEASYLALAHLLKLPEEKEREVDRIVQAVKIWLEKHPRWLLILDNADDLELARSILPTKPRGHILLTTRSQIVGNIATLIQVETLSPEEGLLFLLRRCGVLPIGTEVDGIVADIRHAAGDLVELLSGHPLALDQAGAYIEETSDPDGCTSSTVFTAYRQLYQEQRRLLLKRRGALGGEHPDSVALTFEISVQKACGLHPNCAEVLAFCSLLHPDAIPEELLCQGLNLDQLHLNEVIRALRSYSLIKRNTEKQVLSLHRLVQAVIRDGMEKQTFQHWAERVVQVVNDAFPEVTFEAWAQCERYLPHALLCTNAPLHEVVPPLQVSHLLAKVGIYLLERGQYTDAEPLLVRALSLREHHVGAEHPDTARSLHSLATLYLHQGKYEQADPLLQRALSIREQHVGNEHPDTATSLNNLASLYWRQDKYELAELLYQRALSIREQHLGTEHPDTAYNLNNLASLYQTQGKYDQAEPLFRRALAIQEQHVGTEHPDTANSLNNLANLYWHQGKYELAEPLYQRVLAFREQRLGTEHPDTATSLNNLALLYLRQGNYSLAEPLYQRALTIQEQHLGTEHPDTAYSLHALAALYLHQGKYEQAEPLFQRALAIFEQRLGTEHSYTAGCLSNLATLYQHQGKCEQAEPLYQRALSICEQHLGVDHPDTAEVLQGLAELYQQQGKYEQAEPLFQRALSIREKRLGPNHPDTEVSRKAYATFLSLAHLPK
jgi:tetratricopeptide (TPR) repeat protein/transcriptional regulator with XRE-family HTH domain